MDTMPLESLRITTENSPTDQQIYVENGNQYKAIIGDKKCSECCFHKNERCSKIYLRCYSLDYKDSFTFQQIPNGPQ